MPFWSFPSLEGRKFMSVDHQFVIVSAPVGVRGQDRIGIADKGNNVGKVHVDLNTTAFGPWFNDIFTGNPSRFVLL